MRTIANTVLRLAIGTAAVLGIAALYGYAVQVRLAVVAATLLLPVLFVSSAWGLRYALFQCAISTLAYNYFFLPRISSAVDTAWDWMAWFTFLVTGITASQLAERARRESRNADRRRTDAVAAQQRFTDLVDAVEGVVWEADADTLACSFVSRQAERTLGYPTEQWLREPAFWRDHLHPDDRAQAARVFEEVRIEKRPRDIEYRMIAADGRVVWLRDLVSVVVENGRATRLRGLMVDVTRRKYDETMLREQADLLNVTHDAIFVRTMDDAITFWNRGAEALYGWTAEEAAGKIPFELLATVFPAPLEEIRSDVIRFGRWEGELTHTRKNGARVVVASRWTLRRDERGVPLSILENNNDITERKATEETLQKMQAALTHATRVNTLGEVTASFAHELNQPLAAIVNNADACLGLLPDARPELGEIREALTDIAADARRASAIIERVRALARRSVAEKTQLRLAEVVAEVAALTATDAVVRRVTIHTDVPADLPGVLGDRVQLQQVLLNLIVNAIDAMGAVHESERRLVIRGRTDTDGAQPAVRVSVEDRGVGLRAEDASRLFEAFYTTKPQGMGLGLAISRSIIEAHGGRLLAEPNQGPGATFSICLPTAQASAAA